MDDEQWSFSEFLSGVTSSLDEAAKAAGSIRQSVNQIDLAVNGGQSPVIQAQAVQNRMNQNMIVWGILAFGVYMLVKKS